MLSRNRLCGFVSISVDICVDGCVVQKTNAVDNDLLLSYLEYARALRPQNLGHFIESYVRYLYSLYLTVFLSLFVTAHDLLHIKYACLIFLVFCISPVLDDRHLSLVVQWLGCWTCYWKSQVQSKTLRCQVRPLESRSHTVASVTMQYNLVWV